MGKKTVLGIDFGGSSSKATLLNEDGIVVASATREYPSYYPHAGWIEQDPEDYYSAFLANVRDILSQPHVAAEDIAAISLDAATHMAVLLDSNGQPLRRMIHWSDRRSTEQAERLERTYGALLRRHCCNVVGSAWTLPHLMWLREHEPKILKRTGRICFAKDYVRGRITGDFYTDYVEAMGALLADDKEERWEPDLCELAGIRTGQLPEIHAPQDLAGYVGRETASVSGLKEGTPVLVGTTDTALEVYASGVIAEGNSTIKLATAGRICSVTAGPIPSRQFFNYKHLIPGLWYPGTGTRTCAASYTWYGHVFGENEAAQGRELGHSVYRILDEAAEQVEIGSDGLFFHPYLLGEMTPYYNDRLRASFTGMSIHHTKGHFNRAVMEGVAYSMRDCLLEFQKYNISLGNCRLIGGGAKSKVWRQIMADVLDMPLSYTKSNDSSLGSAMMAGTAIGLFSGSQDSVDKCVKIKEIIRPDPEAAQKYKKSFQIYKELQRALEAVYQQYEE